MVCIKKHQLVQIYWEVGAKLVDGYVLSNNFGATIITNEYLNCGILDNMQAVNILAFLFEQISVEQSFIDANHLNDIPLQVSNDTPFTDMLKISRENNKQVVRLYDPL